jgi:hypothetical protein
MRASTTRRPGSVSLADSLSVAVLVAIALLGYAVLRFPASLQMGGVAKAVVSVTALLAYAVASRWAKRSPSGPVRTALGVGAKVGMWLGAVAVIGHGLEVFAALQAPIPAILGVGMWALIFLLLGTASAEAYRREDSIGFGIMSSVWAALISAVATVVFAFFVGLLFMPQMQRVLAGAFALSGMTDARAFVIRNMLDGASSHLLIAPAVAVLAGAASGLASSMLKSVRRRSGVALAICALLVAVGGVGALRFASSLERPARPPFVMLGLLSLAVALTSAGAVLAVIRDPKGGR